MHLLYIISYKCTYIIKVFDLNEFCSQRDIGRCKIINGRRCFNKTYINYIHSCTHFVENIYRPA